MIRPPYLKAGDTVGILSTGNWISKADLARAQKIIEGWGLKTLVGDTIGAHRGEFAGNDELRLRDMQKMLNNDRVAAILHAHGGYGAVRILERLDYSRFEERPKWMAGYSDVTYFHSFINGRLGIQTIHSTMPADILQEGVIKSSWESLRRALMGEPLSARCRPHELNKPGSANGTVVGGNLFVLCAQIGTPTELDTRGKILFFECVDEKFFKTESFLMNLKRAGKLDKLAGLVVGRFSKMKDDDPPFGKTLSEIISHTVREYDYPVAFCYPAGHEKMHKALILGRKATLHVGDEGSTLGFAAE